MTGEGIQLYSHTCSTTLWAS